MPVAGAVDATATPPTGVATAPVVEAVFGCGTLVCAAGSPAWDVCCWVLAHPARAPHIIAEKATLRFRLGNPIASILSLSKKPPQSCDANPSQDQ